jgi:hypothetical protein
MAEIINLRLAKKSLARNAAEKQAAENRIRFGETKAEKQRRKAEDALQRAKLDAGKLEFESGSQDTDTR